MIGKPFVRARRREISAIGKAIVLCENKQYETAPLHGARWDYAPTGWGMRSQSSRRMAYKSTSTKRPLL